MGSGGGSMTGLNPGTWMSGGDTGKNAKNAYSEAQAGYFGQAFSNAKDPFQLAGLRGMKYQAGRDWEGMGRALGNRQSDIASQGLQDALAARGGGNLSSALGMGAQARVGGAMQGMQAGMQMKSQLLQQLLGGAQARLGLQNQLFGMMTGVQSSQIGAGAQVQSAGIGGMAQMISTLMGGGGSSAGGGGGGEGRYGEGGAGYIPFY